LRPMTGLSSRLFSTQALVFFGLLTLSLAALSLSACSLAVNADRVQCNTKADCAARGGEFLNASCIDSVCQPDPTWACLSRPAMASTQAPPYRISLTVVDLVTQTPFPNAQVQLCRKIDVDCAMPIATATSDAAGALTFSVEMADFAGYVAVQANGVVPTLYFFNPPIDHDQVIPPISLASPAANLGLLLQLGRQAIAGRGSIVLSSADCTGAPAAGVSYATLDGDAMTSTFYTVGGLPAATATATDAGGYGGIINVPSGAATVSATLARPSADLGTISLLVRDGAITYSRVVPRGN